MEQSEKDRAQTELLGNKLLEKLFDDSRKNRRQRYIRMGIMVSIFAFVLGYGMPSRQIHERETKAIETIADFVKPSGTIERTPLRAIPGTEDVSKKNTAHIAVVSLQGTITGMTSAATDTITEKYVLDVLEQIEADPAIKAIMLYINSPGGELIATDNIYQVLRRFNTNYRFVVAYVGTMAASGGYYLALAADEIITHPLALIGNIGAIIQRPDVSVLAERIGIKMNTFKSGQFKDMGNPFTPASKNEAALFQELIDEGYQVFVDRVENSRGKKLDSSKRNIIFDGRIFSGKKAQQVGLIDQTAYFDEALEYIVNTIGRDSYSLFLAYQYKTKKSSWQEFFAGASTFVQTLIGSQTSVPFVALE